MIRKIPIHPLIFSLTPALVLLTFNADPLQINDAMRAGALWFAGGAALYAIFWLILRSPQRAAALAFVWLLLLLSYDPVYEFIRGRDLFGWVYGKHRFLIPAWLVILAAGTYWIVKKLKHTQRLTAALNFASLVLLVAGMAGVTVTGAWGYPLRTIGLVPPPQVEVTYIDVGDMGPNEKGVIGESILLRSSEGKTVLIDGGYPNQKAVSYLKSHNINDLDLVVLTHAHDDHTGGLIDVIRTIPVGRMVSNGQPLDTPIYHQLEEAVRGAGLEIDVVKSGDKIPFGSLVFDVLSPAVINPDSVNINSIVMRLEVGKVAFLFTGDTEHLEEQRLLDSGQAQPVNILKIAHHASSTSSLPGFITAISPGVAIYSAGAGNEDGFPHAVTLETLRSAGATIYSTDMNGTIVVQTDGKSYQVLPERGGAR